MGKKAIWHSLNLTREDIQTCNENHVRRGLETENGSGMDCEEISLAARILEPEDIMSQP